MNILKPRTAEPNHRCGETFWSPVWHHVSAASRLANICKEWPICHTKSSVVYWTAVLWRPENWMSFLLSTLLASNRAALMPLHDLMHWGCLQLRTMNTNCKAYFSNSHTPNSVERTCTAQTTHHPFTACPHAWASQYKMITYVVIYINVLIYNI